jgi:hypothetical protein
MPKYRAYQLDGAGHATGPPAVLEAATDEEALVKAMEWLIGLDLEIWDEARCIARIEHRGDRGS